MKKLYFVFSLMAVCVMAAVVCPQSLRSKLLTADNGVYGRYIVLYNDDYEPQQAASSLAAVSVANDLAVSYGASVDQIYLKTIRGFSAVMSPKQARAMSNDPRIKLIEPDRIVEVSSQQANAPWNLDRIDQRALPWDSIYNYTGSGAGVHVYILDTGIRVSHLEFGGRASIAYDAIGDGQNGNDCNGHGTHVAGIVGGSTWGVAKQATLHAVRVIPCSGSGLLSGVLAGVEWVTANHISPAVANISATAPGSSISLETAINNSIASGVVYTIAAGNGAGDACNFTPARVPDAFTIGASDQGDYRNSNGGPCVDLFAPGIGIVSAGIASDTATQVMSGSSMASPMAAGVAALYLSSNTAAKPSDVVHAIKSAATPNVLDTFDSTSPNLLLYSGVLSTPAARTVEISGRVMNLSGRGLRLVEISLKDMTSGQEMTNRTNQLGRFQFANVPAGRSYTLTASFRQRYSTADSTITVNVADAPISNLIFTANTFLN
jgi:subtilisin family serine protease